MYTIPIDFNLILYFVSAFELIMKLQLIFLLTIVIQSELCVKYNNKCCIAGLYKNKIICT